MTDRPAPTGPPPENPYCMRCSKHLGLKSHETNEHDDARVRGELHDRFDEITREGPEVGPRGPSLAPDDKR